MNIEQIKALTKTKEGKIGVGVALLLIVIVGTLLGYDVSSVTTLVCGATL